MTSTASRYLVLATLSVMQASCSDDNNASTHNGIGGNTSVGGASPGGTGGNSSNTSGPKNTGEYILIWGPTTRYNYGTVDATFLLAGDAPANCRRSTIGDCYSETCDNKPNPALPDAGTITLTDSHTAFTFDLEPWSQGAYSQKPLGYPPPNFAAGDALKVNGSGGKDVPAFTVDLAFPTHVVMQAPTVQSTTQDISLNWSGGKAGETMLVGSMSGIVCMVPVEQGALTIPKAKLMPNDQYYALTLTKGVTLSDTWTITARAATPVISVNSANDFTFSVPQ